MIYTEEILKKIRAFGVVQYSIDKIISILQPENPEILRSDLQDPDSIAHTVYIAGINSGQYRLDIEQFKILEIETQTKKLEYENKIKSLELRKKLFGI